MMKHAFILAAAAAAASVLVATGCANRNSADSGDSRSVTGSSPIGEPGVNAPPQQPPSPQGTYIGTLRGGMVGIGGESTGWILKGDGDARGPGLDVDVSRVREQAMNLEGQRVVIRGRIDERQYVERGRVPVLIAETINLQQE